MCSEKIELIEQADMRIFFEKNLTFIFWTLIIVLGSWGSWVIVTGREKVDIEIEPENNGQMDEIPRGIADQPIIQEVSQDGSIQWTLYMDRITREEGSVMELAKPRALYQFESGEKLDVTGEIGTYDEEAHVLILSGGVRGSARQAKFEFTVDEMVWDSPAGLLTASGGVVVKREGLFFSGDSLRLDLGEEFARMEITGGSGGVVVSSTAETLQDLNDPE